MEVNVVSLDLQHTSRGCRPPAVALRALADNLRLNSERKFGAGNGIRTRDFDLGKVALYH
jgi:hypothetical protein